MVSLAKQFSREKSLVYFSMWDRSDRAGYERFAGHEVRQNLFLMPGSKEKISVYYSDRELAELFEKIEGRFSNEPEAWSVLAAHLDRSWMKIAPYAEEGLQIDSPEVFLEYFHYLTEWWTAMTVAFFIPDVKGVAADIRQAALHYRERGEKYTEIVHRAMEAFWQAHLPADVLDVASVVTPEELVALVRGEVSEQELGEIRKRLRGYGLFQGKVYSLDDLYRALSEADVSLPADEGVAELREVRGMVAQSGRAVGRARIVIKKADLVRVQSGDIIVAEMTNPDYVPWMKLAAAFVTDEGGLTCHAGIVARELGTPCVVGTKMATRVFKDEDLIEVDATNGMVRRIS